MRASRRSLFKTFQSLLTLLPFLFFVIVPAIATASSRSSSSQGQTKRGVNVYRDNEPSALLSLIPDPSHSKRKHRRRNLKSRAEITSPVDPDFSDWNDEISNPDDVIKHPPGSDPPSDGKHHDPMNLDTPVYDDENPFQLTGNPFCGDLPIQINHRQTCQVQHNAPSELVMISTPPGIEQRDLPRQDYVFDELQGQGVMVYILVSFV